MTDSIGWVCPKCSKVYAPHVMECHTCNDMASKQQQAIPNQWAPSWAPSPTVRVPDQFVIPTVSSGGPGFLNPSIKTTAPDIGNGLRASSLFKDTRATSVPQVI